MDPIQLGISSLYHLHQTKPNPTQLERKKEKKNAMPSPSYLQALQGQDSKQHSKAGTTLLGVENSVLKLKQEETVKFVMCSTSSIVVKDLVGVEENRLNNLDLQPRVGNVLVGAHERGPKDDGQVVGVHASVHLVLRDTPQVKREGAEGSVVCVVEVVDNGVKRVAALVVVFGHC